ncbi:phage portal protein [Serratia marcescens]|uniref:phage portal protein n=2 Tax=Serratia TaxID=613 RepID=UPI00339C4B89
MFNFFRKKPEEAPAAKQTAPTYQTKPHTPKQSQLERDLNTITVARSSTLSFGYSGNGQGANINRLINSTLPALQTKARELAQNNPIVRKYILMDADQISGADGISIRSNVQLFDDETKNHDTSMSIEQLFYEWAEDPDAFSTNGRHDISTFQNLVCRTRARDGECFIRLHEVEGGLRLEIIDSLRVPVINNQKFSNGDYISNGIRFNKFKRPISYNICKVDPTIYSYYQTDIEVVPAEEVIHFFIQEYPDQERGIPDIIACTNLIKELEQFVNASIVQKKVSASSMAFITSDEKPTNSTTELLGSIEEAQNAYENYEGYLDPGVLIELDPGKKIQTVNPTSSTDGLDSFMDQMLGQIAMALNVTKMNLLYDTKNSSFSAAKLSDRMMQQVVKGKQNALIVQVLKPIYKEFLKVEMINKNELKLNFKDFKKLIKATYTPVVSLSLDPNKDAQYQIALLQNGLKSRKQIIAELGQDYRDVLKDFEKDEIDNYLNVKDNKIDEQPKPNEEGDGNQPNQSE